jgi:hypothetical protein
MPHIGSRVSPRKRHLSATNDSNSPNTLPSTTPRRTNTCRPHTRHCSRPDANRRFHSRPRTTPTSRSYNSSEIPAHSLHPSHVSRARAPLSTARLFFFRRRTLVGGREKKMCCIAPTFSHSTTLSRLPVARTPPTFFFPRRSHGHSLPLTSLPVFGRSIFFDAKRQEERRYSVLVFFFVLQIVKGHAMTPTFYTKCVSPYVRVSVCGQAAIRVWMCVFKLLLRLAECVFFFFASHYVFVHNSFRCLGRMQCCGAGIV